MTKLPLVNLAISLIALLLSAFNAYWNFIRKPKLKIVYKDEEPYRKYLSSETDFSPEWYIRFKVINVRKAVAKRCVGKIVEWYTGDRRVESFDPIKLHWVSNGLEDYSGIDLSYQEFDYLDLVVTQRKENRFRIYSNTHLRGIPLYFNMNEKHTLKVAVYSEKEAFQFSWFTIEQDRSNHQYNTVVVSQNAEGKMVLNNRA